MADLPPIFLLASNTAHLPARVASLQSERALQDYKEDFRAWRSVLSELPVVRASMRLEDVEAISADFERRISKPGDLWREIQSTAQLELDVSGSPPRVSPSHFLKWQYLQDFVEPETFALCAIVFESKRQSWSESLEWGQSVSVDDDALHALASKGLYDLHVHSGGMRNFKSTWLAMRTGQLDPRQLKAINSDPDLVDFFTDVLSCANWLMPADGSETKWDSGRERGALLAQMLAIWRSDNSWSEEALALEKILIARLHLWMRMRQPFGDRSAGLGFFQSEYFSTSKRMTAAKRFPGRMAKGSARSLYPIAADLSELADQTGLSGIEVRMSPLAWPADYSRWLMQWDYEARKEQLTTRVGFAMHLVRAKPSASQEPFVRTEVDRFSANYQRARLSHPDVAKRFARVDLAGNERRRSGIFYAPYIALLLGKKEALRDLSWFQERRDEPAIKAAIAANELGFEHWLALGRAFDLAKFCRERPLQASWHAGEDFGDVLAGLFEINVALSSGLTAGNCIGHGMALVAEPDGGDRIHSQGGMVTWVVAFCSLVWLHKEIAEVSERKVEWGKGDALALITQHVEKLLGDASIPERRPVDTYYKVLGEVLRFPACSKFHPGSNCPHVRNVLTFINSGSDESSNTRNAPIDRSELMKELAGPIKKVQKQLTDKIRREGVLVEVNPSSNWRIFRPRELTDLPSLKILEALPDNSIICSDDPGTFGTNLKIEYCFAAIGLRALRASEAATNTRGERRSVEGLLENVRKNGKVTFDRVHPSDHFAV